MQSKNKPELLAPAGTLEAVEAVVEAGIDVDIVPDEIIDAAETFEHPISGAGVPRLVGEA